MVVIKYTKEQIDALIKGIYAGTINIHNLPRQLYLETANVLNGGLLEGFKANDTMSFGKVDKQLLAELKDNIYMFSGAKTAKQVEQMRSLLTTNNETLDFKTFKDRALNVYENYNVNYLESEYVTALTSGNNALNFTDAYNDRKLFTQLRYVAILDKNTSEICKQLNGTVANTTDKFWHTHTPPNHFNCRCHIEKIDKYEDVQPDSKDKLKEVAKSVDSKMQPVFKMNSAIDKVVFKETGAGKHPYFDVEPKHVAWAKQNFGLPIPRSDEK